VGLSFTSAVGPRQRCHSQVWVPRDSWPYFTVPHSRLPQPGAADPCIYIPPRTGWPGHNSRHWVPFSSLSASRWATMELFGHASTRASVICPTTMDILKDYLSCYFLSRIKSWSSWQAWDPSSLSVSRDYIPPCFGQFLKELRRHIKCHDVIIECN
jgi:hypothetical protein